MSDLKITIEEPRQLAEFQLRTDPGRLQVLDLPLNTVILGLVTDRTLPITLLASVVQGSSRTEKRYFLSARAGASLSLALSTYLGSYVLGGIANHVFEVRPT